MIFKQMDARKKKFLLLYLVIGIYHANAQMIVEKGLLTTNSMSNIVVKGSLISNGTVSCRGKLTVSGNFTANRGFFVGSSTLCLNGANQIVETTEQSLSTLVIAGGGNKSIDGNLSVHDILLLDRGVIIAKSYLIVNETASVNGGSPDSYVDGFLYHSGVGEKFYPVGKDGTYAPATLLNVSGDNPTVGVAYFPSAKLDGTKFHWQQSVLNGTYDGSAAELTFDSEDTDYQEYSSTLVVLAAEDDSEEYTPLGQSALNTQGTRFTISSDQSTTLPILTVGFNTPMSTKHLYLPNAFSPTAPNTEDRCIKLYGQGISSNNFYLAIQDVWGNIVYETSSKEEASSQGWEGLATTSSVAITYRYRMTGEFIGGKRFQQTGTIVQY